MLDAVVFDYNSTLIDDLDLSVESYFRAGSELGHPVARGTVLQHMSQPPSRKRTLYFGTIPDAEWQAIIARRKAVYAEMARTRYKLFPQTEEVLVRLSVRYRLGLLSNTFRDLYEALFPAWNRYRGPGGGENAHLLKLDEQATLLGKSGVEAERPRPPGGGKQFRGYRREWIVEGLRKYGAAAPDETEAGRARLRLVKPPSD